MLSIFLVAIVLSCSFFSYPAHAASDWYYESNGNYTAVFQRTPGGEYLRYVYPSGFFTNVPAGAHDFIPDNPSVDPLGYRLASGDGSLNVVGGINKAAAPAYIDNLIRQNGGTDTYAQLASQARAANNDNGACWVTTSSLPFFKINIGGCLGQLGYSILYVLNKILVLVGLLFNFVITETLIKMSATIKGIAGINAGWIALRDISNIVIIFSLLYISIATILRLSGYQAKELLVKVIIVALLINFSLFFTKVIIDVANTFSTVFYNKITVTVPSNGAPGQTFDGGKGLAEAFMKPFNLATVANTQSPGGGFDDSRAFAANENALALFVVGSIFMLVAIFVFLAATVLFFIRFVVLIILMVFSPLAFAGSILPKTRTYADKWWSTLIAESFFAPLFMIMIWLSLKIINDPTFQRFMPPPGSSGGGLGQIITDPTTTGPGGGSIGVVFTFAIAVVFLVASLIVAKQLGAYGGGSAMKTFDFLKKKAQRGVGAGIGAATLGAAGLGLRYGVGRQSHNYINSEKGLADKTSNSLIARTRYAVNERLAKASFDARALAGKKATAVGKAAGGGGYTQIQKTRQKDLTEEHKRQGEMTGEELMKIDALFQKKGKVQSKQAELLQQNPDLVKRHEIEAKTKDHVEEIGKADKQIALQTANYQKAFNNADTDGMQAATEARKAAEEDKSRLERSLRNIRGDAENQKVMASTENVAGAFRKLTRDIKEVDMEIGRERERAKTSGKERQRTFLAEREKPTILNLGMPPKKEVTKVRLDMAKSKSQRRLDTMQEVLKEIKEDSEKTGKSVDEVLEAEEERDDAESTT